jgi:hypothetical protein
MRMSKNQLAGPIPGKLPAQTARNWESVFRFLAFSAKEFAHRVMCRLDFPAFGPAIRRKRSSAWG